MTVTVDTAGGQMGGAARFRSELNRYLASAGREDVRVIGMARHVDPAWLVRREIARPTRGRMVALNNVGFVGRGGERWTLLRNALHFLTSDEESRLDRTLLATIRRQTAIVRLAARRSHVLVVPCTSMADRVGEIMPSLRSRIVVRMHPVSADSIPDVPDIARESSILCPVLFSPYKDMTGRLAELLAAMDETVSSAVQLVVTADRTEVPTALANHPRIKLVGQLDHQDLRQLWARCRAIYFPTGMESFGYPLAEARASGQPVIARDTAQNREIAGPALCGFTSGDAASLAQATFQALTISLTPDPSPFDPDAYFSWLLGAAQ